MFCWQVGHVFANGACGRINFIKNGIGTRIAVARALAEDMVWVTAEHAAGESARSRTLKISSGVDGTPGGLGLWMMTLHGLLGWGHAPAG
jgi:hypothetical protein